MASSRGMVVPHSVYESRADCFGLRWTAHAGTTPDVFGLAQDTDAFGRGRVGDLYRPFWNIPFRA